MAEIVRMPKMSDTMEEGVIAVWHKKVGDKVESGELMAEIETDKATMDYEYYTLALKKVKPFKSMGFWPLLEKRARIIRHF